MAITDLYSKRQKLLRGEVPDVYIYDKLPEELKVQILYIIKEIILAACYEEKSACKKMYADLHSAIAREYGKFNLVAYSNSDESSLLDFFYRTEDAEKAIDVIELTFRYVYNYICNYTYHPFSQRDTVIIFYKESIKELNQRFQEHGVGYQLEGGKIIRTDSTFAHSEIVKPAIALLWNNKFAGASEEYLKAHEHYRHGRNKECLTECAKAFESVMKTICKEKRWEYKETDTAKKLIQVCFQNGLVPTFTQNQFTSLQSLLESGITTIRNKLSAHGQGDVPQKVDDEMTRYGLNLTGTNIIFLVEQSGIK